MISIVIPFFNEEKRLDQGKNLNSAIDWMVSELEEPFELIFVDDGSKDNTVKLLKKVKSAYTTLPIKILSNFPNRGKGYAVRCGVLKSSGNKIIAMDADFSIALNETKRFINDLDKYDLVIGSKKHLLTQTKKEQTKLRRILGKLYTLLTNTMLGLNFTDITCGFKGYRSKAGKNLFSKQKINRWSYESETLFMAKKLGYSIKEVPVTWNNIEDSRVSLLPDAFESLKDLLLILYNYYSGKYN